MLGGVRVRLSVSQLVKHQLFVGYDMFEEIDFLFAIGGVEDLNRACDFVLRRVFQRQFYDTRIHDGISPVESSQLAELFLNRLADRMANELGLVSIFAARVDVIDVAAATGSEDRHDFRTGGLAQRLLDEEWIIRAPLQA